MFRWKTSSASRKGRFRTSLPRALLRMNRVRASDSGSPAGDRRPRLSGFLLRRLYCRTGLNPSRLGLRLRPLLAVLRSLLPLPANSSVFICTHIYLPCVGLIGAEARRPCTTSRTFRRLAGPFVRLVGGSAWVAPHGSADVLVEMPQGLRHPRKPKRCPGEGCPKAPGVGQGGKVVLNLHQSLRLVRG